MGLRGGNTIGTGPVQAHDGQTVQHVHAGTHGRLLRLCMNVARNHPEWIAVGQIEAVRAPDGTKHLRQKLVRRNP